MSTKLEILRKSISGELIQQELDEVSVTWCY